ncbi:MAG: PEP-CTERM sorting domain-containing protein [Tepidisphaeraceae bacterium]|jgi:PEP-CTERM motif-containing protein
MLRHKLRRLGILAVPAAAVSLMATSAAKAQPYVNYFPFDTSSSVTNLQAEQYENPSGGVLNTRLEGGYTGISAYSDGWTNAANYDGDVGGGSVKQSVTFNGVLGSPGKAAFDLDMYWTAETVYNISFYLQVAPGSADSGANGASYAAGSSGYFGVATRDQNYDWTTVPDTYVTDVTTSQNFGDQGGGFNFGDPGYSGNSDAGDWLYINMPFPNGVSVAGLTFQDYVNNDANTRVAGNVTWYIDDLTLSVPEPASLGLLGLTVPALLMRRRKIA